MRRTEAMDQKDRDVLSRSFFAEPRKKGLHSTASYGRIGNNAERRDRHAGDGETLWHGSFVSFAIGCSAGIFFAVFPVTRETLENQVHPKERRKP
ncbi:MAG: hypothetical protein KH138_08380 [Firmicutes bacterium]|nr:hypothetical protein [Bacillota bacterium]